MRRLLSDAVCRLAVAAMLLCIATSVSAQSVMDTIWVCATYDTKTSLTTLNKYVLRGNELYDLSLVEFGLRTGAAFSDKNVAEMLDEHKYRVIKDEADGLIAIYAGIGDDGQKRHQLWADVIMINKKTASFRDISLVEMD